MAVGLFGFAAAASAHVTVSPSSAPQGSFTVITFRVPNEEPAASTTKLDVSLDTSHPIAVVDVAPVDGWTAVVKQQKLATPIKDDDGNEVDSAPGEIIWTADSAQSGIQPGQFQQFPIELGPLPDDVGALSFKALQTYSDGTVVRWIDETVAGQPEPDHPAPVLTLTPADTASAPDTGSDSATPTGTATSGTGPTGTATSGTASGTPAKADNTWGIVGTLLGAVGLILGGAAYARTRSTHGTQ